MITNSYMLCCRIPIKQNRAGGLFCDELWAKDLKLHLLYIQNFYLCCPIIQDDNTAGLEDISEIGIKGVFALKKDEGIKSIIKNFLPNFLTLLEASKKIEVIHSDAAGWFFPLSYYILFLKPVRKFSWIIVVESSPWRLEKNDTKSFRNIASHFINSSLMKLCLRISDLRIFTQSFYATYFLGKKLERVFINPATWIDKENIIKESEIVKKYRLNRPVISIIFPSRLQKEKGVLTLLNAIDILNSENIEVKITIMGDGSLKNVCKKFCAEKTGSVKLTFKEPIKYDSEFFNYISEFDYVLVPTEKQEQPRIIFDAFSQGVSVIGSDNSGVIDITTHDNAQIFESGNPKSLAEKIMELSNNKEVAKQKGINGLSFAKGKTHLQMHMDRKNFIESAFKSSNC